MCPITRLYYALCSLALAQVTLSAAVLARDDSLHSLCNEHGLSVWIYDRNEDHWDTSWFGSVIAAFAHADPDTLKAHYEGVGTDIQNCENDIEKVRFKLMKANGEMFERELLYGDIPSKADRKGSTWLVSGFQKTGIDMGGYMGFDKDSISFGDPTQAFHMLTGKKGRMDNFSGVEIKGDEEDKIDSEQNEKDRLYDLLKKCKDEPIVFGTLADKKNEGKLERWTWYAVTNVVVEGLEDGYKEYTASSIKFWNPNQNKERELKFKDFFADVRRVAFSG